MRHLPAVYALVLVLSGSSIALSQAAPDPLLAPRSNSAVNCRVVPSIGHDRVIYEFSIPDSVADDRKIVASYTPSGTPVELHVLAPVTARAALPATAYLVHVTLSAPPSGIRTLLVADTNSTLSMIDSTAARRTKQLSPRELAQAASLSGVLWGRRCEVSIGILAMPRKLAEGRGALK